MLLRDPIVYLFICNCWCAIFSFLIKVIVMFPRFYKIKWFDTLLIFLLLLYFRSEGITLRWWQNSSTHVYKNCWSIRTRTVPFCTQSKSFRICCAIGLIFQNWWLQKSWPRRKTSMGQSKHMLSLLKSKTSIHITYQVFSFLIFFHLLESNSILIFFYWN